MHVGMHLGVFVSNTVNERKRKFLQKFILKKKSRDLFDQFVSMTERGIDIIDIRFALLL